MKLLTLTLLAALLCGCQQETPVAGERIETGVGRIVDLTNSTVSDAVLTNVIKPKFKPFSVVCSSDGSYAVANQHGELVPFALNDLGWAMRAAASLSNEYAAPSIDQTERMKPFVNRFKQITNWSECQ